MADNNSMNNSQINDGSTEVGIGISDILNDKSQTDNSVTDSLNDNSDNSTDVDVGLQDAFNDKSNNSTNLALGMEDSLNNSSTNNSNNDASTNTNVEVGIEDSFNSMDDNSDHSDNSTDLDLVIQDALNDKSINDSFNDNSQSSDSSTNVDVALDVAVSDSFNSLTDNSVTDSNNDNSDNSFNLDVAVSDAFNSDSSTSWGEIAVQFENVFNGAFGGGDGTGFAINQVADIVDNDTLSGFHQNNQGNFQLQANGGGASVAGDWDSVDDPFGSAGGSIVTTANAAASAAGTAFNMDVVMGANLQQNAVNIDIVSGDQTTTTTSGDSF